MGPQLLGGVFGWGIAAITAMAGLSCIAAAWAARRDEAKASLSFLGAAATLALGWTLVQALPLPRLLTGWLQPRALTLADEGAELLGDAAPDWVALSIAPGATWAQVVQGAGLVAAFLAAATIVSLGHRRRVFQAVGVSVGLMAAIALMHLAAGAERVFGVYDPIHSTSPLLAPIVNQNELAGFLAMGAPVLAGLGLDEEDRRSRAGWLFLSATVGACALLAVSRGGVASLVVGFLALGILGVFRGEPGRGKAKHGGKRAPLLLIAATFAAAVGLGLYVAAESLYEDFEHSGYEKLDLAARGFGLALDHPFVGVGRGAFSAAIVSRYGQSVRIVHPENLVAQWCVEWGFVVAGVLLVALAIAILRASRRARSWAHLGGVAGLIAIFAHDMVDFALELAGIAVVAGALLGGVTAPSRRRKRKSSVIQIHHAALLIAGACVVLAVVPGLRLDERGAYAMQVSLEEDMRERRHDAFQATLIEAVRAHPSEPAFVLLGGAEAGQRGDPSALRWLNRAMVMAPGWASPHLEAGRYLVRSGHLSQGLLELREAAVRGQTHRAAQIICSAVGSRPGSVSHVLRIFGTDDVGDQTLDDVAGCLPAESDLRRTVDAHLVERNVVGARIRSATRALGSDRPEDALAVLEPAAESEEVLVIRARAYLALDQPGRAIETLAGHDGPVALLRMRAQAEAHAGERDAMLATVARLRTHGAGDPARIARAWILQGVLLTEMDQDFDALHAFSRAHRVDPNSAGLRHTAMTAERIGDHRRAYQAWSELCRNADAGSAPCRSRDRCLARVRESLHGVEQLLPTP